MTAPSIQLATGMSTERIASSVHAFETIVGAGASFAEHLDRAVQSSPRPASRPETQLSDLRSAMPKPTSDAPQTPRTQVTTARHTVSQTKQNSDPSSVQKDQQCQPESLRNRDSRPSDNSRNSGRRQAGDEETPAKDKSPLVQAVARSAASQSEASSATQPAETSTQPSDASIPAALLALLQAAQSPAQAVAVQPSTTSGNEPAQTDSSSTDTGCVTPSNLFQPLNLSTSNTAYQAALTNLQTSMPTAQATSSSGSSPANQPSASAGSANSLPAADQQTSATSSDSAAASTKSSTSASPATSENNNNFFVPLSGSLPQVAPAVSTASTANTLAATAPASQAASTNSAAPTAAPASQGNAAAGAAHAMPARNGQQAETNAAPAVKPDAGQHEATKPALEELTAAARAKAEPVAAELQQAVVSVTVTNHVSSSALSRQVSANDSQSVTAGQDSGSPTVSATQGSAAWTGDSAGDSAEGEASAQTSSASQGANGSKTSSGAVEFLPSSAFNSDTVSGVAPAAVHAVAAGTLQSNTGLENASSKTPEAAQNFNTAAQEKAFTAWQSVSAQIGRVVNTATLNALQNGTEMRVQLRTDAFGSVDIRATLEGGKVGAAIGVESVEARNALLSQLPALQQSLNERQVQLDQVSVVSSYGQSGTDFGTGSGKQNGDPTPSSGYYQQASGPGQVSEPVSAPVTEAWQPATSRGRLSVRA